MAQITVTLADGTQQTVDTSALTLPDGVQILEPGIVPDGFVTKAFMESTIQARLKGKVNRADALNDENLVKEVLTSRGIELDEAGNPKIPDVSVAVRSATDQLKAQHTTELEALNGEIGTWRKTALESHILQEAEKAGIDTKYRIPISDGATPFIVQQLAGRFKYNDEIKGFALVGADGNFVPSGLTNKVFAGAEHIFAEMKGKTEMAAYFKDVRQEGSGFSGGASGAGTSKKASQMSVTEKSTFIREHGPEAFEALRKSE